MSRNRSSIHKEKPSHFQTLVTNAPLTDVQLHRSPVAIAVSVTGERTVCPIDTFNIPAKVSNNSSLAMEYKARASLESTSEELVHKFPTRKQRADLQKRRKFQKKDRRITTKLMLTQRNSSRPKPQVQQKCVAAQTDSSFMIINHRVHECIGDAKRQSKSCLDVGVLPRPEKDTTCSISELSGSRDLIANVDNFLIRFLPESLKILMSYIIMVILIFWLTSVILDVEVPFDIFKMATNYIRYFRWNYYRNEPQTNAEKCLEFITKLFK